MASISKQFASGTSVIITAKATISAGDASSLAYAWERDGTAVSTQITSGTATLVTSTAGTYKVVVSHPNAETVTSDTFVLSYRNAVALLRIQADVSDSKNFDNVVTTDHNIANSSFEFGPDNENGFDSQKSGWWRLYALEEDISLNITLRGSTGAGSNGGAGGIGVIKRTFEKGQIYTIRTGDNGGGYGVWSNADPSINAPNGGRILSGGGKNGGGQTYLKRGGTLLAVAGGGGGQSSNNQNGGDGGGPNVSGSNGSNNSGSGAGVQSPGDKIHWSGYPKEGGCNVRVMTRCGTLRDASGLSCDTEVGASDVQNNGGFGYSGGGGGGSGVKGGCGGTTQNEGGGGGSGWASDAVEVVSSQLGGNAGKQGSCLIRKSDFLTYIVQVYHATANSQGIAPQLTVTNAGTGDATVLAVDQGSDYTTTRYYYELTFLTAFDDTNYVITPVLLGKKSANLENLYTSPTISQTENVSTTKCKIWLRGDYQNQNTFMNEFIIKVTPS